MNDKLKGELLQLSTAEKLELIGELWDSIDDQAPGIEFTPEELAEFERRMEEHRRDPSSAIPVEEVIAELRSRLACTSG